MDINAVITGDLVKLSKIRDEDIGAFLKLFKKAFNEINKDKLNGEGLFYIYRGDSFQVFVKESEKGNKQIKTNRRLLLDKKRLADFT